MSLAEKLKKDGITSNCYHPFIANTGIFYNAVGDPWYWRLILWSLGIIAIILGNVSPYANLIIIRKISDKFSGIYCLED